MCSSSLRRMSDDSNGSQPVSVGEKDEEEKRSEENAGHPDNPASGNRESFPENTPDSGKTTDEEDRRGAGGETGKQVAAAEDDVDGFRTPNSLEHRIPVITECPPAPRKPHPSRCKRRRSPAPIARRCLEFDTSEEVESFFWSETSGDEDGGDEPENKKARKEGDNGDEGRC